MKKAKSPSNPYKENQAFSSNLSYHSNSYIPPNPKNVVFYNQFMQQQKTHPKVQNPRVQSRQNRQFSINIANHHLLGTQQSMNKLLVCQNQLLLNELLNSQLREAKYKERIRQLKMKKACKNNPDLTFREERNYKEIGISDRQLDKQLESQPKHESSRIYVSARTMQTEEEQGTLRNSLLDESFQYIRHTERSIENQIDQLNEKLCRLLQSTTCEQNKEEKFKQRAEMSDCIKELKQLRKCYQNIKS